MLLVNLIHVYKKGPLKCKKKMFSDQQWTVHPKNYVYGLRMALFWLGLNNNDKIR